MAVITTGPAAWLSRSSSSARDRPACAPPRRCSRRRAPDRDRRGRPAGRPDLRNRRRAPRGRPQRSTASKARRRSPSRPRSRRSRRASTTGRGRWCGTSSDNARHCSGRTAPAQLELRPARASRPARRIACCRFPAGRCPACSRSAARRSRSRRKASRSAGASLCSAPGRCCRWSPTSTPRPARARRGARRDAVLGQAARLPAMMAGRRRRSPRALWYVARAARAGVALLHGVEAPRVGGRGARRAAALARRRREHRVDCDAVGASFGLRRRRSSPTSPGAASLGCASSAVGSRARRGRPQPASRASISPATARASAARTWRSCGRARGAGRARGSRHAPSTQPRALPRSRACAPRRRFRRGAARPPTRSRARGRRDRATARSCAAARRSRRATLRAAATRPRRARAQPRQGADAHRHGPLPGPRVRDRGRRISRRRAAASDGRRRPAGCARSRRSSRSRSRGARVTERLAVDVAIVGGGIAACAAAAGAARARDDAWRCSTSGACGAGASGVNFGGVRQQGRHLAELPLSRRAREIWPRLAALVGEDVRVRGDRPPQARLHRRGHGGAGALRARRRRARPRARAARRERGCASEHPWLGPTPRRRLALRRATARPIRASSGRPMRALRAQARRRDPRVRRRARRAVDRRAFELEADGVTVHSRTLINAAGAWGGQVARWFGERVPLAPLMPNMLVTEPLPYFGSRRSGCAAATSTCARSSAATSCSAAVMAGAMSGSASRGRSPRCRTTRWASPRCRPGARRRAGDPHLERHGRRDPGPHPGARLLVDDAAAGARIRLLRPRFPARAGDRLDHRGADCRRATASPIAPFAIQRFADWTGGQDAPRAGIEH